MGLLWGLNKTMHVKQLASVGGKLPTMVVREQFPSLSVWVLKRPGFVPRLSRFGEQPFSRLDFILWGSST